MRRPSQLAIAAIFLFAIHVLAIAEIPPDQLGGLVSDCIQLAAALLASFACYSTSRRSRHFAKPFWFLTGSTFVLWSIGQILEIYYEFYLKSPLESPTPEMLVYFLSFAPLFIAVFLSEEVEGRRIHWEWILDAVQMLVLILAIHLYLIYVPTLLRGEHALAPLRLQILVIRNIVLVAAMASRAVFDRSPLVRRLFAPVAAIMGVYTVGTWFANHATVIGHVKYGNWYDLAWTLPLCMIAMAAATWRDAAEPATPVKKSTNSSIVLLAYLPSIVLPFMMLSMYEQVVRQQVIVALSAIMVSIVCFSLRLVLMQHRQHHTMEALRNSEHHYRMLFERNMAGVFRSSIDGKILDGNEAFANIFGYHREELKNLSSDLLYFGGKAEWATTLAEFRRANHHSKHELCLRRKDGGTVWVLQNLMFHTLADQQEVVEGTVVDITERKLADMEISGWKDRYDAAVLASGQIIYDWYPTTNEVTFGGALSKVLGYAPDDFRGTTQTWRTLVHPEDLDRYRQTVHQALESKEPVDFEYRVRRSDGKYRMLREQGRVVMDQAGNVVHMVGFITDVTEHRTLEQQFRQAQKMEAVGRLAGGIAHDFNNMLTVIMGYSELQLLSTKPSSPLYKQAEQIKSAALRATALTRQLLAFSRQQVLQPRTVNLNMVVSDLDKMLRRLIGEDIAVRTLLAADLGSVEVDPSQTEQVLMNLVVNARDAMPQGGKLTIETANVELDEAYAADHPYLTPGRFVRLSVSDSGMGMDAETRSRIFEPFFTTKEMGKGTGLGLSTVYGIVKQSGGSIEVYSEPGHGSTFFVYLPRVDKRAITPEGRDQSALHSRGSETILLVEDDEQLRELAKIILDSRGYRVLSASNLADVEAFCTQEGEHIDLLLTDVVMPNVNGTEIARLISKKRPGTRILYMSGYTADATVHHGVLEEGVFFLQKPFSPAVLAAKVREILDIPLPA